MVLMDIIFVSFDDTLHVPAPASPFALPRESVIDLFHRGRDFFAVAVEVGPGVDPARG
jgi:hypothetical protein